jgi:hypothetical protein
MKNIKSILTISLLSVLLFSVGGTSVFAKEDDKHDRKEDRKTIQENLIDRFFSPSTSTLLYASSSDDHPVATSTSVATTTTATSTIPVIPVATSTATSTHVATTTFPIPTSASTTPVASTTPAAGIITPTKSTTAGNTSVGKGIFSANYYGSTAFGPRTSLILKVLGGLFAGGGVMLLALGPRRTITFTH